jgi:putative ATP-binding cassette transporter
VVAAELLSRLLLLRVSSRAVRDMRMNLCEQILKSPLRRVERSGSSGLMAALTEDVHRIAEALIALPTQCVNIAIAVACFSYLFYLSWPLALGFVGIYLVGIVAHELISRAARPSMKKARAKWDELIGLYTGIIDGNKELKLHRRRRQSLRNDELVPTADDMMRLAWRWNSIVAIGAAHTQLVFFALLGLVLFVAPRFAVFEPGVLSGFVLMALFMSGPIAAAVGASPKFHMADVSLKTIRSLGLSLSADAVSDVRDAAPAQAEAPFGGIELRDVVYRYVDDGQDERAFVLGPVNLRIRPGELMFIVGGNGSGKSSLMRILTGLYTPTSGTLTLNGNPVDDDNRDDYRQNFAVVFSDYHLFKSLGGVLEPGADAAVDDYLRQLELSDKVRIENGRLSTVDLSQGQRKRLALLTAFLENRHVFMFDEWAADQDPAFKKVFYHRILPELKARGRTVIVVSHDDQYFESADRIVRFADGRIVEDRYLHESVPSAVVPAARELAGA